MMAVAHPKLGVRPFLPADAPLLREIFRDSIEELTADDYTEAQQEAWASTADDVSDFAAKLSGRLTLVATLEGSPVGFAPCSSRSSPSPRPDAARCNPGRPRPGASSGSV